MRNLAVTKSNRKLQGFKDYCYNCSSCFITKDFVENYYQNAILIRDNDRLVHIVRAEN